MINRINSFFFSSQIEFRFRIFRLILVMGTILSLLGAIEGLYVGIDILPIIFNLILFISMVAGMIFMFYYHKPDWAVFLVGFMMVTVGFPPVFLTGGGVDGGASIWFVIGIIYPFIMYSGKKMVLFVSYAISIDLLTYVLAFHFPEFMSRGISREIAYADSVFSVVVVGVTVGIVLKYQTRQYEKERELAIAQKEGLEKLEQSRNQFFASMSHEIRTPIYSIVGHNELNLRWELPEEVMDNALVIDDSGKMLLSLVNDILDMAQLEMGNLKIIPVEYNTKELFNDLIHMMQPSIKEKELDFFVNIDGNLPTVMLPLCSRR